MSHHHDDHHITEVRHTLPSPEVTYEHEPAKDTKRIWRTFWILLGLTVAELALGLSHYAFHVTEGFLLLFIKGAMIFLSLLKAIYIVGIFMHLGDEMKGFRMMILVPLSLFVWFIIAFLWDGVAWKELRHKFNRMDAVEKVEAAKPEQLK